MSKKKNSTLSFPVLYTRSKQYFASALKSIRVEIFEFNF